MSKEIYTPDKVRAVLNIENNEIKELCKKLHVYPKKDIASGKTFFFKKDVEVMKEHLEETVKKNRFIEPTSVQNYTQNNGQASSVKLDHTEVLQIISKMSSQLQLELQENILNKVSKILDEKLDGLDDIVFELINSKAENERLRDKNDALLQENYDIKSENLGMKYVGFGFYKKK